MKILFLINSLHVGGAERIVLDTADRLINDGHDVEIFTLMDSNELLMEYEHIAKFVSVIDWKAPSKIYASFKLLKKKKPEIICSLLYFSDFIGSILAKILGCKKNIWWIHNLNVSISVGAYSYFFSRINAFLSYYLPTEIIYCSELSMASHLDIGYRSQKSVVITNPFELDKFYFSEPIRFSQRNILGYNIDDVVIGYFCRWDPCKNYPGFLNSMARVNRKNPIKILLIGSGLNEKNEDFVKLVKSYKNILEIKYIDGITNLNPYYSAIDIFVQFSKSESYGLCLCEAISAECFSISSNVGIANLVLSEDYLVGVDNDIELEGSVNQAIENGIYKIHQIKKANKNFLKTMIKRDDSYKKLCEILM
jgi:glycosyltransferase involved in cell wall biosynthesis